MSNGQQQMKPLVSGQQTPAKLIQLQPTVNTSGVKQPIKMVTTPQGVQNINRTGVISRVQTSGRPVIFLQNNGNGPVMYQPNQQGQGLKKYVTAVQASNPQQMASSSQQIKSEPQQQQQGIKVENFKVATVAHTQVRTASRQITLSKEDQTNVSKCRNFLTTLIKLAAKDGQHDTQKGVKCLVQKLVDDKVTPQVFTQKLQELLQSNPQPYLVPFLTKSLPLLRLSMVHQNNKTGEVPTTIAESAIRVSHNPDLIARQTNQKIVKPLNKLQMISGLQGGQIKLQPNNKPKGNSVPEIRLPRSTFKHSQGGGFPLNPPHPNTVQGASPRVLTTPVMMMNRNVAGVQQKIQQNRFAMQQQQSGQYKDDDDINDVTSMAGVDMTAETHMMSSHTNNEVGVQMRSCKDESKINNQVLQTRMTKKAGQKPGIKHIHADAVKYLSQAVQEYLKGIIEKVVVATTHRMTNLKEDPNHEPTSDVKSQLKFLQKLDELETFRNEENKKNQLMKAMKSRSKNDNPEQAKMREKAKILHQKQMEIDQRKNADQTALYAIGNKRRKIQSGQNNYVGGGIQKSNKTPRIKRAITRDLLFVLGKDENYKKSELLYRAYIK